MYVYYKPFTLKIDSENSLSSDGSNRLKMDPKKMQTVLEIVRLWLFSLVIFSGEFTCSREVSTIVCAHEPDCVSRDCNGHGQCVMGQCLCDSHWRGDSCNVLKCEQHNCSSNGQCSAEGEVYVEACLMWSGVVSLPFSEGRQLVFTGRQNILDQTEFFIKKNTFL